VPQALFLVLALAFLLPDGAARANIANTKHNFGAFAPAGNIQTSSTSEICVFCHTPHNSSPAGPIWNRADSGATYNVYASQSLAATLAPNPSTLSQPTGASKLCLSCHDGTIAIGYVRDAPGAGASAVDLNVTGANLDMTGKLSPSSVSYIGTDLRKDHPISFAYSQSYPSNTEIKGPGADGVTFGNLNIKLDSGKNVQCTTCHDPHGTPYPKFLTASIAYDSTVDNLTVCTSCHDKRYWSTNPSVHKTSTSIWNGQGTSPWYEDMSNYTCNGAPCQNTPETQSCLACHRSHGGAIGRSLLKFNGEEEVCLACHDGNLAAKNMDVLFNYAYKHDVKSTSTTGLHTPSRQNAGDPAREDPSNLGGTNRHVKCADCHNAHGTMSGNHTVGGANGNIVGNNMLGGWGVKPNPWGLAGTAATMYNVVDMTSLTPGSDNLESYVCIKCHSYYAYLTTPPSVPSGNADGSLAVESDLTEDANINNFGYHPVFENPGQNQPPLTANPNWPTTPPLGLSYTFMSGYLQETSINLGLSTVTHTSTITCSDCHGSSNPSDPKGPHGSSNKWILRSNETGIGTLANFCYNCHRRDVYGDEGYVGTSAAYARVPHPVDGLGVNSPFYAAGANTGNSSNKFGNLCLTCHGGSSVMVGGNNEIKGIHGSNAAAGSVSASDPLGYRMMNGACVESYIRPTTLTPTQMFFRVVTPATDKVCNNNFTNFTNGVTAIYNCNSVGNCAN